MFLDRESQNNVTRYINLLKIAGSLSNLFSESDVPYINYRLAENLFCQSFEAINLSRSDCSIDAKKENIGIGIKTFINYNGRTYQKIAEFNKQHQLLAGKEITDLINDLCRYRNSRIEATKSIHSVEEVYYHCITRQHEELILFEDNMHLIDLNHVRNIVENRGTITFNDRQNEYAYNKSKSTLFQKFVTPNNATRFDVKILQNPMQMLEECYARFLNDIQMPVPEAQGLKSIVLPLYSSKSGNVEPKSGLNQWNADDEKRRRKPNEMYIPVPVWIHHQFPDFFPPIDISFNLKLPNQRTIIAKMCQTQIVKINGHEINKGKSLMSNPNSDLGKWILRDILNVPENQIVTKNDLDRIGIDSVEIEKIDDNNYDINFKQTGEFERFKARNE